MKPNLIVAGLILAAALSATAAPRAIAADRPAESARVPYEDLDLSMPAGRAALERRIRSRARAVCRREMRDAVWQPFEMHSCVTDTIAHARMSSARVIARANGIDAGTALAAR